MNIINSDQADKIIRGVLSSVAKNSTGIYSALQKYVGDFAYLGKIALGILNTASLEWVFESDSNKLEAFIAIELK